MTNPARRLAQHLALFNVPPHESVSGIRSRALGVDDSSLDLWRAHGDLMALVREVDYMLIGMQASGINIDGYKPSVPHWYRAVLAVDTPWNSDVPRTREALPDWAVNSLNSLGSTLDMINVSQDPDEARIEELRKTLEDAAETIRATRKLSAEVRRYLGALIAEAQAALDDFDRFGASTARRVVFTLGGAMLTTVSSGDVPEESKSAWGAAITTLLLGAGTNWLSPEAIEAAGTVFAGLKAITGG